jgi:hypothetical protein
MVGSVYQEHEGSRSNSTEENHENTKGRKHERNEITGHQFEELSNQVRS